MQVGKKYILIYATHGEGLKAVSWKKFNALVQLIEFTQSNPEIIILSISKEL